jgi:uridine kinase
LLRKRITTTEAVRWFFERGREDKARLLQYRQAEYFDVYSYGSFMDYYYGELAPDTSYLQFWDILPAEGGFLFLHPEDPAGDRVGSYNAMPNFFTVFSEGERWGQLMECQTVADLNELVRSGRIRELIRVNEALHEKRYSQAADKICQRGARAVMLGDTVHDAEVAREGGMDCILVSCGHQDAERLREAGVPVVADVQAALALMLG